jgi:hypothetical protein
MTLSSSGWRGPSSTWRVHSGSSSNKSAPWCARDTSPGIGTWPPPIRPTSERVWWGARQGSAVTRVDAGGVEGFQEGQRRQEGGAPVCQQRLARGRGPGSSTVWLERPHHLQLYVATSTCAGGAGCGGDGQMNRLRERTSRCSAPRASRWPSGALSAGEGRSVRRKPARAGSP